MFKLVAVLALVCAAAAHKHFQADIVEHINSRDLPWTATVNPRFEGVDIKLIKHQMGAWSEVEKLPETDLQALPDDAIPTSFDARVAWSFCNSTSEIRDQSACGSCWAFGAVESMTDRFCIHSNGTQTPHISAQDLNSCCGVLCGDGCNGGYPSGAWNHFKTVGLVTGGNYNSTEPAEACSPYSLPNCDHHVNGSYPNCDTENFNTPACVKSCKPGYPTQYTADKHFGASAYSVSSNVAQIQTEIMTNGPVESTFTVYEDFLSYSSGVYVHTTGAALGGHAIKILGWGVLNNVAYWTVANSWNTDWGNKGFFLIKRGVDECGIEDGVVAGLPKL